MILFPLTAARGQGQEAESLLGPKVPGGVHSPGKTQIKEGPKLASVFSHRRSKLSSSPTFPSPSSYPSEIPATTSNPGEDSFKRQLASKVLGEDFRRGINLNLRGSLPIRGKNLSPPRRLPLPQSCFYGTLALTQTSGI